MARSTPQISESELQEAAGFRSALRRFLARTEEVAGTAGLTSQRYDLLLAIRTGEGGTSTISDLTQRLSMRQPTATELVKRAEAAGLIERSVSKDDHRVFVLGLTARGERHLAEAFLALRDDRRQLADALSTAAAAFRSSMRG